MNLTDPVEHSEAMLGYHDPTLRVGIDARGEFGGMESADGEGFFSTLLDIINPLQHIPLVSSLYREITGDEISPAARILGGGLFGGPIGLATASANAVFEQASGDDILGHTLAAFSDESGPDAAPQQAGVPIVHEQAAADLDAGIVMSGPPALASLKAAPREAAKAPSPLTPPPAPQKTALVDQAVNSDAAATPADADAAETEAFLRALPANWVNEALRDAATVNQAVQNGDAPALGEAKPWVGNAILDALSKYEAMTRARAERPANQVPGAPS